MPSRATIFMILAFWALMLGWQLVRQYGQLYSAAPKFLDALDEAAKDCDEAQTKHKDRRIYWTITLDNKRLGKVTNEVNRNKSLFFTLKQEVILDGDLADLLQLKRNLDLLNRAFDLKLTSDLSLELNTDMDVDYFGTLRFMNMRAAVHLGQGRDKRLLFNLNVRARAEAGDLVLSGRMKFGEQDLKLPKEYKVKYDSKNLMLNSLCPVDVMPHLRPGQTWEAPMLDLQGLLNPGNFTAIAKELTPPERKPTPVRVLNEVRPLQWNGQEVPCLVVESRRPGLKVTVYVRQADGRVLKQVAEWGERVIEIVRDPR